MKSKTKLIAILASVGGVVIVGLVIVVVVLLRRPAEVVTATPTDSGRGTVLTEDNLDAFLDARDEPIEDGYYTAKMNNVWSFPSGSEASTNAYVANSERNTRTVYFEVSLDETGELLYSSPFIPVGGADEKFALDGDLEAGTYDAIVTYHLVDDDHQEITTTSVGVTLEILA